MKIKNTFVIGLLTLLVSRGVMAEAPVVDITGGDQELQNRVSRLETMMDGKGLINILNEVESLQHEVRELRGQVEQQAYAIEQMEKRQQSLYDDLDSRLSGGTSTTPVVGQDTPETAEMSEPSAETAYIQPETADAEQKPAFNGSGAGIVPVETYTAGQKSTPQTSLEQDDYPQDTSATESPASSASGNEDADYSEAFNLLKEGKHEPAVEKFRAFIAAYPDSDYTDNAQYWLGESFYARRKFEEAIKEYKALLSHYPDSGKASHALLKIGYSYDEMGQKDFAQGELEDLISRYPGTSAAQLAEDRLRQIRSQ